MNAVMGDSKRQGAEDEEFEIARSGLLYGREGERVQTEIGNGFDSHASLAGR